MKEDFIKGKAKAELSVKENLIWKIAQLAVFAIGFGIVYSLIFYPNIGINLMWNILIPLAPLIIVVAVGLWRNICPLASFSLLPRTLKISKKKKLSKLTIDKLNLIGVILLFTIVPFRHAILNNNGPVTAMLLIGTAIFTFILGLFYDWKSAWCGGLCPVYPVEKLYGVKNKLTFSNAHCTSCSNCLSSCPDSTPSINNYKSKNIYKKLSIIFLVGGLPGFIYGWFQVPDYYQFPTISQLIDIYKTPMLWAGVTTILYVILKKFINEKQLIQLFATLAVSCYYWFRVPALFGFGIFPEDGKLIDLTHILPSWSIQTITITMTLFFFWWLFFTEQTKKTWMIRPVFEKKKERSSLLKRTC